MQYTYTLRWLLRLPKFVGAGIHQNTWLCVMRKYLLVLPVSFECLYTRISLLELFDSMNSISNENMKVKHYYVQSAIGEIVIHKFVGFEADHYLLFDFPGQVELFTLHSNAKNVILEMVNKWNFQVWFWNSAVYITLLSEFSFSQDKSPLNNNANLEIAEVNHVSFQPS